MAWRTRFRALKRVIDSHPGCIKSDLTGLSYQGPTEMDICVHSVEQRRQEAVLRHRGPAHDAVVCRIPGRRWSGRSVACGADPCGAVRSDWSTLNASASAVSGLLATCIRRRCGAVWHCSAGASFRRCSEPVRVSFWSVAHLERPIIRHRWLRKKLPR